MIRDHDIERLVERVIAVHMAAINMDEEETKHDVRRKYNELRQGRFYETVYSYRERFENAIEALRAVGETIPTPTQQAYDFLAGLDNNRYYQLKLDYKNRVDKTTAIATLDEAYMQASTYIIPRRNIQHDAYYTNRAQQRGMVQRGRDNRGRGNNRRSNGRNNSRDMNVQNRHRNKKDIQCYNCGKYGHYANECTQSDNEKEVIKLIEEEKSNESSNNNKNKMENNNTNNNNNSKKIKAVTVAFTIPCDTIDDFDNIINGIDSEHNNKYLSNINDIEANILKQTTTNETILIAGKKLTKFDIVLDSGSSCNIFANKYLLNNLRESDDIIMLNGVKRDTKQIITNMIGDTLFGEVYYSAESITNILSYGIIKDRSYSTLAREG